MNSGLCWVERPSLRKQRLISKHALHAAHDQPLEMQLQSHAQVKLPVQRVMTGNEWAGGGAAGYGLHDRRFHLHEAPAAEKLPQRRGYAGAALEHFSGLAVHDQVHVTAPIALLAVGQPVELLRQRAQGLGQQGGLDGFHAQLAAARPHQRAARPHDVTQVQRRGVRVGFLAHRGAAEHELQPPAAVLDFGKTQASHAPLRHQPTGHAHLPAEFRQRFSVEAGAFGVQARGLRIGPVAVGKRPAGLAQGRELAAAFGDQAVFGRRAGGIFVGRRGHCGIVRRCAHKLVRTAGNLGNRS